MQHAKHFIRNPTDQPILLNSTDSALLRLFHVSRIQTHLNHCIDAPDKHTKNTQTRVSPLKNLKHTVHVIITSPNDVYSSMSLKFSSAKNPTSQRSDASQLNIGLAGLILILLLLADPRPSPAGQKSAKTESEWLDWLGSRRELNG